MALWYVLSSLPRPSLPSYLPVLTIESLCHPWDQERGKESTDLNWQQPSCTPVVHPEPSLHTLSKPHQTQPCWLFYLMKSNKVWTMIQHFESTSASQHKLDVNWARRWYLWLRPHAVGCNWWQLMQKIQSASVPSLLLLLLQVQSHKLADRLLKSSWSNSLNSSPPTSSAC